MNFLLNLFRKRSLPPILVNSSSKGLFQAGQRWSLQDGEVSNQVSVVILRIDEDSKLGPIVHIRVEGLHIPNPNAPNGISEEIGHLPYAEEALSKSVEELLSSNVMLPDDQEGYLTWREAFNAGKAGVFTIPVKDAVDHIRNAISG